MEISNEKMKTKQYNATTLDLMIHCAECNKKKDTSYESEFFFGCENCKIFVCEDCLQKNLEKYYGLKRCPDCGSMAIILMPNTIEEFKEFKGDE